MSTAIVGDLRIRRQSLHDVVVDRLRDLIVEGVLRPGQRLNERLLCEQLGVSRTPLRESFKVLASEGLIEILPNRGATVAPLTIEELRRSSTSCAAWRRWSGPSPPAGSTPPASERLEALHRAMLEHHRQGDLPAYFRVNQEIHLRLVEATGNRTLLDTYTALNLRIRRYPLMANLANDRWAQAVAEHEEIMQALRRRDGTALGKLLQAHLRTKTEHVMHSLLSQEAADGAAVPSAAE